MSTAVSGRKFRNHLARTLTIAWPIVIAQGVGLSVIFVDTIMVGHAGRDELASLGAGRSLMLLFMVGGMGLLNGVLIFSARYHGAGRLEDCGRMWRAGIVYAHALGLVGAFILALGGGWLLTVLGVEEVVREGGSRYLAFVAPTVLFSAVGMASSLFLQGVSNPRPAMVIQLGALPFNVFLNWIFIYGNLGAPSMGAAGAALATSIVSALAAAGLFLFVTRWPSLEPFRPRGRWRGMWAHGRAMRRFGVPVGAAGALEFFGMTALIMFAGQIGALTVAAIEVAFNLHLLAFLVTIGVTSATAVRVGNAVGRKDSGDVVWAVLAGIVLGIASMVPFIIGYMMVPGSFVHIFIGEADVVALATGLVIFIALALPFDAVQMIMLYSLRALGDQWISSALQVFSFFVVMVVVGWVLAFGFGLGAVGLVIAMLVGVIVAAVLLSARFALIHKRLTAFS
ncbi:MAG: MATE family efflux transporter [Sphingomonadales bacterium]